MRRYLHLFICLALILGLCPGAAYAAPAWPDNVSISAEGGIVMDANTGAVLYGKNIHVSYFPASITKILTALIVIENCNMDDVITFSHNAVYNVEIDSSNAGLDEGDQLTVRDALYAMLLRSANEAANALAEHTAGSIDAFAAMMNAKAVSLGCTESHFNNPSGLNDPDHYTTAYDMALIAQAAFANETFVEIDSTLYYDLPVTKKNPDGLRIYPGHKMLKKNLSQYYPGIIGGKTGYTSLAGNTLVTCAQRDDLKLIVVILNGHQTHYTDTKALLDFSFRNFKSLYISDYDRTYSSIENDMTIAGLPTTDLSVLSIQKNRAITLPNSADFSDASTSISYDLSANAPEGAVACITYSYGDRQVGSSYLMLNEEGAAETRPVVEISTEAPVTVPDSTISPEEEPDPASAETSGKDGMIPVFAIPSVVWIVLAVIAALAALIGGLLALKIHIEKKEEAERLARYQRRQQRLQDIGMSTAEFDLLMNNRRTTTVSTSRRPARRRKKSKSSFLDFRH